MNGKARYWSQKVGSGCNHVNGDSEGNSNKLGRKRSSQKPFRSKVARLRKMKSEE